MEGVSGLISEKHSLKRVRFGRKAIERDSESPYAERQLSHFTPYDRLLEKERRIRKPYSLYRNSAESGVLLNHHNNLRVENDRGNSPMKDHRSTKRTLPICPNWDAIRVSKSYRCRIIRPVVACYLGHVFIE